MPDASRITPGFVANKRGHACRPGARFASVAFVTGALDPLSDRVIQMDILAKAHPVQRANRLAATLPKNTKPESAVIQKLVGQSV